ncbi:16S rRNA (guanine(527)-N(7))-methyltransferase RsmG [Granulicella paludicola]|uniref:16S rRNA (guanine(527)-N(7))-methyltransferase RsmG n=1 Tax=Granulicella paludicola TaxID=474951 RepID=UPI0021E0B4CF|nr:16S rRNA (guanine(527)-N(7))-methyltransferase RsmG [Granulicella paludicola]
MSTLLEPRLKSLLSPYLGDAAIPANLYIQLSSYLDLLVKWNARTNLTAIRDPEQMVVRHFGESLFCGLQLARRVASDATVLDFGSGAGFPGIPIQLLLPELKVTLGESQNKKATFLREATRSLVLPHTEIWAKRVEDLPASTTFQAVTLRAVDNMQAALAAARPRVASGGYLITLSDATFTGESTQEQVKGPGSLSVTFEQL